MNSGESRLLLGVDGGGTGCRARLCDLDGRVLGEGEAGPANTTLGIERAFGEVLAAARSAFAAAGLGEDDFSRAHAGLGLAGMALRRDHDAINGCDHPFAGLRGETDAHIACLGAHGGRNGAILIIGTGSCGLLIKDGVEHTAGGWGFLMSDHGGGAQLGRQALRRALQEHEDIVNRSGLGGLLMASFDDDPEKIVIWSQTAEPRDYAAYVPEIFDAASNGDDTAQSLVRRTAAECDQLVSALIAKGAPSVCIVGGLAEAVTPWLSDETRSRLAVPEGDALDGAVYLGRKIFEGGTPA